MRTKFWKPASVSALVLAMSAVSCNGPAEDPVDIAPIFPEQVNETIEPGQSYELTINPNLPWEVAISGDTEYFRLISRGEPLPVVSGQAGEHKLTVEAIVDESDFEQRQCILTMTMGKEEKQIAVINRNGKDRIFSLWPVKITSDGFDYGDDVGGYNYAENESADIDLYFDGNIFQIYMKVEANFDWALKETPEWVEPNVVEGRYVTSAKANVPAAICLRGVNAKYPLDGAEGKLVFIVNDNSENPMEVEKEITLSIEPVKNVFEVSPLSETARFNKAGHYYNEMNGEYQEGYPMKGSVIGTDGVKIFAVQMQDGVYSVVGSSEQYSLYGEWVNFTLTDNEPEDVLKDWSFTVSVDANEGASRKAELMIIPGTVEINDPDYDLFNDTATAIKDELAGYVYSLISQEGSAGGSEGGLVSADNDALAAKGARFESLDASNPENGWISVAEELFGVGLDNYYQLTVTRTSGTYNFTFVKNVWDVRLYEVGLEGLVLSDVPWLEPQSESSFYISLTEEDAYKDKFIVCQTGDDSEKLRNFAVIKVLYDPEASISGGSALAFKYAQWGGGAGCMLRKMSETEDGESEYYWACKEQLWNSDEIYELTYGQEISMPTLESTIEFDNAFYIQDEDKSWLTFEGSAENLFINMETTEAKQGALVFTNAGMPVLAIVCKYNPAL